MKRGLSLHIAVMTVIFITACSPTGTSSFTRSAVIEYLENDVQTRDRESDEFSPAEPGQLLPIFGEARTGENSRAQLNLMQDGSIVRLGPNTSFTLTALSDQDQDFFSTLALEVGNLWIILLGGELEVETQVGIASVRGSFLGVYYDSVRLIMTATCLEGNCSLANDLGTTTFMDGQAADIFGPEQGPSEARAMTEKEYEDWYKVLQVVHIGPRIGDWVWLDINMNGIQDLEEQDGIKDVLVQLFDDQDRLIGKTHTDENGYFSFPFPASGSYYLSFVLPAEYVFSPIDEGEDDKLDSDADPITGKTIVFTYTDGHEVIEWDAGAVPRELAPTPSPTVEPSPTPTSTPTLPPPPCGCETPGVQFEVVYYDGSPGWSDCGQSSACHSIIGDNKVASGSIIGGGSCQMLVICPQP